MFDIQNGYKTNSGDLWCADGWIHMAMNSGMISLRMPRKELSQFIEFLLHVPINKNGSEGRADIYRFSSGQHDVCVEETTVNITIADNTLVIFNIDIKHIPALTSYLNDYLHDVDYDEDPVEDDRLL